MKCIALTSLLSFSFFLVHAQSNPTPYDLSSGSYSFMNWPSTSSAGTYPPNIFFHRGPKQDPGLADEPNDDYTDAYNSTSGSRMNGLGTDGFSWRNTGTSGTLGAAVLALKTTGMSTVRVSWTGGTVLVDNPTRDYRIRLQYRVGTDGSFTDVPGLIEYIANSTAGHSQNFGPTLLPPGINNQPVVQLRWKYYATGLGSNSRPQLRVSNILVEANTGESSGDGTGSARVFPDTLKGSITTSIQIIYRRDTSFTVNGLRIVVPSAFVWSHNSNDISFTNMTADKTVGGDTISFTNISFNADSAVTTIANVTSPDTTGVYIFKIQSKQNEFADIASQHIVVFGNPLPIADMKANDANGVMVKLNQLITVHGIVTVANQFNGPSYIQDNSGGIAVFGSSFSTAVNIGDEVIVSGLVQPFNGLSEIVNPVLHSIVSSGNAIEPQLVTASQIANDGVGGLEVYECTLVRLNAVTVTGTGNWAGQTNYPLSDATGSTEIRISGATELVGTPVPAGVFDLIAVVGQFKQTSPIIGGYQLMPRFKADLISSGPIIESLPIESNIQPTSLTISWTTLHDGTTRLRYGATTTFELGTVENDNTMGTSHSITLNGLTPASIYYFKAFSVSGSDTSFATTFVASTASNTSTGKMNVYFNYPVDTVLARGENAQKVNIANKLINRINAATYSIDVCLYSLSGTVGANIASALLTAWNSRSVKVRVIGEAKNSGTDPWTTLSNNGVPVIFDTYDAVNAGAGLMHNKFVIIDNRDTTSDTDDWVWTGSWNATDPGNSDDAQNAIEIQDKALANAYTTEFNEMWGSNTDTAKASVSRFGARKLNNTPHYFVINGTPVELYFSPSDGTNAQILKAFNKAKHSINFAIYSFTRNDLGNALISKHASGIKIRGVIDNRTDSGEEYDTLAARGCDVHLKANVVGLLHHKYAIIDAGEPDSQEYVVTGSHNWSSSAENANNENTLIINSRRIANLYLQEFSARYTDAGGTDVLVSVEQIGKTIPTTYGLSQNYPNPFNPATTIDFQIPKSGRVLLKVYDILGREVLSLVDEIKPAGNYRIRWDASALSSGVYFYRLESGGFINAKKMILLK